MIEERDIEAYIPRICAIETAAVVKRLASKALATRVSNRAMKSYNVVGEDSIFDIAWEVALDTGCSGFDSYFIALAKVESATLLTDDSGMHLHVEDAGASSILMRNTDPKRLKNLFDID